ncbi:hypothetical protein [Lentibacillus daqui]|uniref:hypothetical protein n=1 Tax=Lentibacillus daqui TaxID=2911514 RepID=UPI0022B1C585|nr:hypothetical protein [Lentibacillus daqui]
MNDLLQSILPLIGVGLGGWISYWAQTRHQNRIEETKNRRMKLIAYNTILGNEGNNSPLEFPIHYGEPKDFDWKVYVKGNRKVLYENLHLFKYEVVTRVLHIDEIAEKCEYLGPGQEYIEMIFDDYHKIIMIIKQDYKKYI